MFSKERSTSELSSKEYLTVESSSLVAFRAAVRSISPKSKLCFLPLGEDNGEYCAQILTYMRPFWVITVSIENNSPLSMNGLIDLIQSL